MPASSQDTVPTPYSFANAIPAPLELLAPAIHYSHSGEIPSEATTELVRAHHKLAEDLTPEQLYEQLEELLMGREVYEALQWLRDTNLLLIVLPELDATVAFSQEGGRRHKDVWDHTKTVVRQAVPQKAIRWSALLHDIGKVPTRRYTEDGKVTFHAHAEVGVRMFLKGPARRIAFPAELQKRIELLILYHLRAGQYETSWTDSAVRRFSAEMGDVLEDLLNLSRADITSKRPGKRAACLKMISLLATRISELATQDAKVKPLPSGLGSDLMTAFELPAGKHLAQIRQLLEALYEEGEIEAQRETDYYLQAVRDHNLLDGLEIIVAKQKSDKKATTQDA